MDASDPGPDPQANTSQLSWAKLREEAWVYFTSTSLGNNPFATKGPVDTYRSNSTLEIEAECWGTPVL
jgi:hypothetical protein